MEIIIGLVYSLIGAIITLHLSERYYNYNKGFGILFWPLVLISFVWERLVEYPKEYNDLMTEYGHVIIERNGFRNANISLNQMLTKRDNQLNELTEALEYLVSACNNSEASPIYIDYMNQRDPQNREFHAFYEAITKAEQVLTRFNKGDNQ